MAELKIRATTGSVKACIDAVPDEQARKDCRALARVMKPAASVKMTRARG